MLYVDSILYFQLVTQNYHHMVQITCILSLYCDYITEDKHSLEVFLHSIQDVGNLTF